MPITQYGLLIENCIIVFLLQLLDKIPNLSDMTDVQKAGIYGLKTHFLMQYGPGGNILALDTAKVARDLDPEMAEWWFMVGKAMGWYFYCKIF